MDWSQKIVEHSAFILGHMGFIITLMGTHRQGPVSASSAASHCTISVYIAPHLISIVVLLKLIFEI